MDVVIFTFLLDSFPRYKNASKRISDILERAKTLLYDKFGKLHPLKTSPERNLQDNLKIYHCEKEGLVQLELNEDNLVMKNNGVQDKTTYRFENTESFFAHYLNSLSSTTVLIFQYYNGLIQTLENCLPPEQPVIIVAKKQNGNTPETYCHINWKTVSTEENISEEISSLLEQMAFQPMKDTFENIKSILEESHTHKVSKPLYSASGLRSSKQNPSKSTEQEIRIPGDVSREVNGCKRKHNEMKENVHVERNGNSDAHRVDDNAYIRKTRSGTLLGTNKDKKTFRKCMENKAEFQRLLGEMIGMYRRSKLPKHLKPQLDGPPEGEVSEQVMMNLYKISPSIRGYSYKFITRLQIHVLSQNIEKLKPKITDKLDQYGFASDTYDIVPPLDDVKRFCKIHAGSKVSDNIEKKGTLTSFVKTKSEDERKGTRCCLLASKHLLDGRETIQISSREQTITATVIKETAPGDRDMSVDIAAAIVKKEDENICDGRFKTEDGKLTKGIMFTKDDSLLACRYVHINGATTSLGLGIIATTHLNIKKSIETPKSKRHSCESKQEVEQSNEDGKFIYVESRKTSSPFCAGGDSGAMVCADDNDGNHVDLISTVNGKVDKSRKTQGNRNEEEKEEDNDVYQTLRLQRGVSHLTKLIKCDIEFFDC